MNGQVLFGKKWLYTGLTVAVLNPIFSGIVLGSLYLTEPGLRKYGRIILPLAVVWGVAAFWLARQSFVLQNLGGLAKKFSPMGLI